MSSPGSCAGTGLTLSSRAHLAGVLLQGHHCVRAGFSRHPCGQVLQPHLCLHARMAPSGWHVNGCRNVGGGAIFQLHGFQGTGVIALQGTWLAQKLHKGKRCGWDLGVEVRRGTYTEEGLSLGFLLLPLTLVVRLRLALPPGHLS